MVNDCWVYEGWVAPDGYGHTTIGDGSAKGHSVLTHRAAYEVIFGPIPAGLQLDHLCRNRACYNPHHLEPVTPKENRRRGRNANAEKTHCPQGHPYAPENTYIWENRRLCRSCRRYEARCS